MTQAKSKPELIKAILRLSLFVGKGSYLKSDLERMSLEDLKRLEVKMVLS